MRFAAPDAEVPGMLKRASPDEIFTIRPPVLSSGLPCMRRMAEAMHLSPWAQSCDGRPAL